MGLVDVIATIAILFIIGCASAYIINVKKKGKGCIGCPHSGSCQKNKRAGRGECDSCGRCCDE